MGAEAEIVVSIKERLLKEREALLDLSTRNRLLNTPLRTRNIRAIEIVDEKSTEVFRLLSEGKSMSFLPGIQLSEEERANLEPDDLETGGIPQPEDEGAIDERGIAARHSDTRLQTRLTTQGLQKRLFDIWYDARTLEEEQGVNILYLALGLLRWYENDNSDLVRHAPLVLMPVTLGRSSAADRFHLKGRSEPPSPNLTLQAKMKAEFGLVIEDFNNEDELDLTEYTHKIAETVEKKARWEVLPDAMVLGFFSFSKFLMYRDLSPEHWPEAVALDGHPLVAALLRDGFPETNPLVPDDMPIDLAIPALELNHVVDADSSQAVVIAEAAGGRTMVVKGPPGTGKSQTITNIIAAAVAKGRKVLFVAEKMAALEVVHRRLRNAGLGPLALELHSNKVNKRSVLEELKRTKDAAAKTVRGDASVIQKLGDSVSQLNSFAERLHAVLRPCGLSPYQVMGRLIRSYDSEGPSGFALRDAASWSVADFDERRSFVIEIAERLLDLGAPPQHPWRGVRRDALDPSERDDLSRRLGLLQNALREATGAAKIARDSLSASEARTLGDLARVQKFLQAARSLPRTADQHALGEETWRNGTNDLRRLIVAGETWSEKKRRLVDGVVRAGWRADYLPIRTAIATKGTSIFRFLSANYRAQIGLLRSYLKSPLPKSAAARLAVVDWIIAAQEARHIFETAPQMGSAFGFLWKEESSDWRKLQEILSWREAYDGLPDDVWSRLSGANLETLSKVADNLEKAVFVINSELAAVCTNLDLDLKRALDEAEVAEISLGGLEESLNRWTQNIEALSRFIAFAARGRALAVLGCESLVQAVHDGLLDSRSLPLTFERSYCDTLRSILFQSWPELRAFDGDSHDRLVQMFRQFDRARIELAKEHISAFHSSQRPRANGGVGPLGVLNAELAKKRGHLPVRQLLDKAGPAIQQLKPVFMMSPLSVAQFLKPGGMTFDVLVMDEASQIEPVDALGAIARVGQIVVVGDEKQLPPTAFFKKLTGDNEKDEGDDGVTIQAKDAESILDLCLAKGAPYRMLSWHYRSKHQSLIAVSNREFYENRLFIVPSPYDAIAGMGLKFHLLRDAPYDRGGTRTNPNEAKIVAEAVMRHATETPTQSLGVGTFSVAQRQVILKELELLRRGHPEAEDFFSANAIEPFFVKNLENIQGDERDVIIISVGYGKTEQGYLAHAFGPLSGDGGERRLNVLISRAKMRCEVYCNFTGADLDLDRTKSRGVAALKLFLTFAETGKFGLGESTGADHDSEFEVQVCERLRSLGYDVKAQIGASGFRVDLAVADPDKPGRFILGIECDGAQYHSSRSARDRDRLRQQVLEAHGWIIHRIWSADWYLRPQEELKKVETAIAGAKAEWRERDEQASSPPRAVPLTFEAEQVGDVDVVTAIVGDTPSAREPERALYKEAAFPVNMSVEPHETSLADMCGYVIRIVQIEGPVHIDEIATRIRMLWGLQRAGSRIRAAVTHAAELAAQRGLITRGPFYSIPGQKIVVRDRSEVASGGLRKPEMLPPIEIDECMLKVITENFGATRDDLVQATSRLFGYSSTSAQLRAVFEPRVDHLMKNGALEIKGDILVAVDTSRAIAAH